MIEPGTRSYLLDIILSATTHDLWTPNCYALTTACIPPKQHLERMSTDLLESLVERNTCILRNHCVVAFDKLFSESLRNNFDRQIYEGIVIANRCA